MSQKKTLAQLPYPSKEWDEEKERQEPGWVGEHGAMALLHGLPMSEARRKRIRGYLDVPSKPSD